MKKIKLKVRLFWNKNVWFNGNLIKAGDFAETKETSSIEEARSWTNIADYSEIYNEQNIKVQ